VVRQKVEAHGNYEETTRTSNGIVLLKILKGISFHFQSQKYPCHSIHEAIKLFYNCSQGRFETTQAYMEHFQKLMDVVIQSGGSINGHTGIEDAIIKEMKTTRDAFALMNLPRSPQMPINMPKPLHSCWGVTGLVMGNSFKILKMTTSKEAMTIQRW